MSFLLLACAVWGAAAVTTSVVVPGIARVRQDRVAIAQYDSLLAEADGHAALRNRLQAVNDSLRTRYGIMSAGLGDAEDLSGLLEMLIGWAKAADIDFVSVQPGEQTLDGGVTTFPVVLQFKCPYDALGRFVAGLESRPHIVRVDRLSVGAESSRRVQVGLMVTLFLRPQPGGDDE